jgi:hypothetical protein
VTAPLTLTAFAANFATSFIKTFPFHTGLDDDELLGVSVDDKHIVEEDASALSSSTLNNFIKVELSLAASCNILLAVSNSTRTRFGVGRECSSRCVVNGFLTTSCLLSSGSCCFVHILQLFENK